MHSRASHRSTKGAMTTDLRPSAFSRNVVIVMWDVGEKNKWKSFVWYIAALSQKDAGTIPMP